MAYEQQVARCRAWNADQAHQVAAGKARARTFTLAHQSAAGLASYAAFSARFRADHGSPPLNGDWVRRYVAPDQIRGPLGAALPAPLQQIIFAGWCAGIPYGTAYWFDDPDAGDLRAVPVGSLFDPDFAAHQWVACEPGWAMCSLCYLAAICPACLPDWAADAILARLPQVVCKGHSQGVMLCER
jgi:hypothetical protein